MYKAILLNLCLCCFCSKGEAQITKIQLQQLQRKEYRLLSNKKKNWTIDSVNFCHVFSMYIDSPFCTDSLFKTSYILNNIKTNYILEDKIKYLDVLETIIFDKNSNPIAEGNSSHLVAINKSNTKLVESKKRFLSIVADSNITLLFTLSNKHGEYPLSLIWAIDKSGTTHIIKRQGYSYEIYLLSDFPKADLDRFYRIDP